MVTSVNTASLKQLKIDGNISRFFKKGYFKNPAQHFLIVHNILLTSENCSTAQNYENTFHFFVIDYCERLVLY